MLVLKKLEEELKVAMKAKDAVSLGAIRLIKTAVKNKEIELLHPLSEAEFIAVLATMAKKNKESIEQFEKGGRNELAEKEKQELAVIERYLPKPLSDAEVDQLIQTAIQTTKASGPQDMGVIMKAIKEQTAGKVDGKLLSAKVRESLAKLTK